MRVPVQRRRPGGRCPPAVRSDPSCTKRRFQEEDEGPAMKLHMSEDAVSACLERLSLENDHSYGGNGLPRIPPPLDPQDPGRGSPASSSEDESVIVDPGEFSMSGCKVICPVVEEQLQDPRPERLLHSLTSPCLDLILWSPPSGPIHRLLRSLAEEEPRKHQVEEGMEL